MTVGVINAERESDKNAADAHVVGAPGHGEQRVRATSHEGSMFTHS